MTDETASLLDAEPLASLPWLAAKAENLLAQRLAGRFPPSLLLSGVEGVGKRALAAHLARTLLCAKPLASGPCGQCRECGLMSAQTHPDLLHVTLGEKDTVIKVDVIREVNQFAVQSPQTAAVKVVVIDPADALNLASANAFLKTLEEPSSKTFFILIHDTKAPLLPTINSRCQRVSITAPPRQDSVAWLAGKGVSEASAIAALDLTAQAPLAALAVAGDTAMSRRSGIIAALGSYVKGDMALDAAVKAWGSVSPDELIPWQMSWLEQMTRYAMTSDADVISDPVAKKMLAYLAERNPPLALHRFYDELRGLRRDLRLVSGLNKELIIIRMLAGWQALMHTAKQARRQA